MKFFGRFGVLNPQEEVMGLLESEGEKGHIVLYDTTPLTVYSFSQHCHQRQLPFLNHSADFQSQCDGFCPPHPPRTSAH
jgi:hypothetical protein